MFMTEPAEIRSLRGSGVLPTATTTVSGFSLAIKAASTFLPVTTVTFCLSN